MVAPVVVGGIIAGAGALAGGLLGGAGSKKAAKVSAAAAKEINEKQLAWQREAATNAHQWEVQDLQAAGLNPILSAGGSGASVGTPQMQMPDTSGYQSAGQIYANTANNILNGISSMYKNENTKANTNKTENEAENINADTTKKNFEAANIQADTAKKMAEKGLINKQEATEISKQALAYAQTQQVDVQTKQAVQRFTLELEQMEKNISKTQIEIEQAKAEKDYKKSLKLQTELSNQVKEYEVKYKRLEFWLKQSNVMSQTLSNSAAAVKHGADAAKSGVQAVAIGSML